MNLSPCFTSFGVVPTFSGVCFGDCTFLFCTLSDKGVVLKDVGFGLSLLLNGSDLGVLNSDKFDFKSYLTEVSKIGEEAKNKDMLRSGISSLAYSPLIGSQAAMESAANISKLTGVNMAAIANEGDVMAQNPTKERYAGKFFRV